MIVVALPIVPTPDPARLALARAVLRLFRLYGRHLLSDAALLAPAVMAEWLASRREDVPPAVLVKLREELLFEVIRRASRRVNPTFFYPPPRG